MISYLSSIVTVSILHRFRDIITYFPKLKDVTWPWPRLLKGQFVIPVLKHHMANQCTKFQVSSFRHFGDILGGNKKLNGSRDHNHASFRDDLSSMCWDKLRFSSVSNLKSLRSLTTKIWKATKNAEIRVILELWVTQGHLQHSHSIEHIWLPIWL